MTSAPARAGSFLTLDAFRSYARTQRAGGKQRFVIPVYRRLSADLLTPVSAFLLLREAGHHHFLLESVEGGEKLARYSFLGRDPYCVVRADGTVATVEQADVGDVRRGEPGPLDLEGRDIFAVLREAMERYAEVKIPGLPRFSCGAVGYMGYDTVRLLERLPPPPPDPLGLPDALWCFYATVAAFDHVKHQLILMSGAFFEPDTEVDAAYEAARARIDQLEEAFARGTFRSPEPVVLDGPALRSNTPREDFEASVRRAKTYIYEGDIFQVVLSQRFEMPFRGDRFNLYRALRQVNPSPYLFYLDFGAFALVGSSPEVLVRAENGRAEVLPIAGTRRRGDTPEEDALLETELLADPKERAEHLMLVDLGRNDLGRVCDYDSVEVTRYAFVERYSHVMHLVSSVAGQLARRQGPMDVLAACFPAGTVSGAPKVRAMEIINELETAKRGVYAGAVGYLDFSGNMDTCIAIRTMVVRDGTIYVQAGAGIVADSNPAHEYEETVNKARALQQAMLVAAEGLL